MERLSGLHPVLWIGIAIFSLIVSNTASELHASTAIKSTGTIEKQGLLKLKVVGKYIVNQYGRPVHLVGAYGVLKAKWHHDVIFYDEVHLDAAKTVGMQVLRIGIDMGSYVTAPYTYNDTFFSQPGGLDRVVDWADRNRVYVVIESNMANHFGNYFTYTQGHGFPEYMTPSDYYPNNQTGMYNAWKDFWRGIHPQEDSKNQLKDAILHVVSRYKDKESIMAWEIPCNEPSVGDWMSPSEITPMYYTYVREIIDAIRSIDPNHIIFVETFWYNPLVYLYDDISRDNTGYSLHPYGAGAYKYYDPTAEGIAQGDVWNKAGLEKWTNETIYQGFLLKYDRPVYIGEIDTRTEPASGDWHQWYWDMYELFDKYETWVSSGFRAGAGDRFGLWYSDQVTFKPYVDVLTAESNKTL